MSTRSRATFCGLPRRVTALCGPRSEIPPHLTSANPWCTLTHPPVDAATSIRTPGLVLLGTRPINSPSGARLPTAPPLLAGQCGLFEKGTGAPRDGGPQIACWVVEGLCSKPTRSRCSRTPPRGPTLSNQPDTSLSRDVPARTREKTGAGRPGEVQRSLLSVPPRSRRGVGCRSTFTSLPPADSRTSVSGTLVLRC